MLGWILNAAAPAESLLIDRSNQQPIYYVDNTPVYEVWFWHSEMKVWFVMLAEPSRVAAQGAIGFHPLHTNEQVRKLIEQWRSYFASTSNFHATR